MQPQAIAQAGKGGNLKSRRGERQAGGREDELISNGESPYCSELGQLGQDPA